MNRIAKWALKALPRLGEEQMKKVIIDLAEENELSSMVFNSLPGGVLVADNTHHLIFVNRFIQRILPVKKEETASRFVWEAILNDEIAQFLKESLMRQERIEEADFTLKHNAKETILSFSLLPLVASGKIKGSVIFVEDVTRKRREEALLRRAESLASLTTVAAGVAHEIKNPLGAISIHLQLMGRLLKKQNDGQELSEYLRIVEEEVERLNGIVVDFLATVHPMTMNPGLEDLNDLINDLLDVIGVELREKNIAVHLRLSDHLPKVRMDKKLMKHALLNIVKNGMAAMADGGEMTLRTGSEGDVIWIEVEDTGVGMDELTQQRLFEPFFTTRAEGSGLGLTMVYKILREHGGEVLVDSTPGKGSRFRMTLPVSRRGELRLTSQ